MSFTIPDPLKTGNIMYDMVKSANQSNTIVVSGTNHFNALYLNGSENMPRFKGLYDYMNTYDYSH